ncbi:uncharacterized protein [Leptinotarsa decemlineata]|uniref:uncharacterized protein n=1 Tax=Leptinotarsa decemlineata TaxID=7539 RepID=UPI003D3095FE
MTLEKEISVILDDEEEPLCKRLKIADNAFKCSELPLQCKPLLLKWILKSSAKTSEDTWRFLNEWLSLDHFQKLTRNEIDIKEIKGFIKLLINTLESTQETNENILETIINTVGFLVENRTFLQYFVTKITDYCRLIACVLDKIQSPMKFTDFIRNKILFHKSLILAKDFVSQFLSIVMPKFVENLVKFDTKDVFLEVSKVIQKCIFYNNRRMFANFMDQFFTGADYEDLTVPKTLFLNLLEVYKLDEGVAKVYVKLMSHAFSVAYDDFELFHKFFIVMLYIQGFELSPELTAHSGKILEIPDEVRVQKISLDNTLELLRVLSETKTNLGCKFKDITFSDLLKNILTDYVFLKKPSSTKYKVVTEVIKIDPLIVQSLTDQIIVYSMMADNRKYLEAYEELVVSVFDIYSKLHRVENLVSKMVGTLKQTINVHSGSGKENVNMFKEYDLRVEDIFTKNILSTFSRCISSLASWQVINVFKTLIYSLKESLERMSDGEGNKNIGIYMHILSVLIGTFLSSIRVAEHTVTANVIEKTIKCLDELQELLRTFGIHLLNREHDHILMRSFLNIAFYWAEMSMILKYYSVSVKNKADDKLPDSNYSPCNLTFIHSYLNVQEWCLISERITNFGEPPCKQLMYKLFIQRVRAMHLFLPKINDDIVTNLLRNVTTDLNCIGKYLLEDKFSVNFLLPRMETNTIVGLAETFFSNHESFMNFQKYQHILNSSTISNAVIYVCITKMNKLISKHKRKRDEDTTKVKLSTRICALLNPEFFLTNDEPKNLLESAVQIYSDSETEKSCIAEWKVSEEKLLDVFRVLRHFPAIYSSDNVQKMYLLYFCSLHKDLSSEFLKGNYKSLQLTIENNIIGMLQECKFKLSDVFKIEQLCSDILDNFVCGEETFSLVIENIFRSKESVQYAKSIVSKVSKHLSNPLYMQCSIVIMNGINRLKKSKMPKDVKNIADSYKELICERILQLVLKNEPTESLVAGYAYSLKHYLSQNNADKIAEFLNVFDKYNQFALGDGNNFGKTGYLTLFTTVLQNKSKIKAVGEAFPLNVWNACKGNDSVYSRSEEYSQLISLIVGHIPNENFEVFTKELLNISESALAKEDFELFPKHLKTWEAILSSDMNPVKCKVLQSALENLLYQIFNLLESHEYDAELFESVLNIEKVIIQTSHMNLTPAIMDILLLNITTLLNKQSGDFPKICNFTVSLMSSLLKYRKPLVMDRLPPFLQQYRKILRGICERSSSDSDIDENSIKEISDCAHQLEKLTKILVNFQKDMGRIAMYLIADILEQYENVTLLANVKIHLNNCIYSLMSICDQHAVSYLMRVLSSASTEIFKIMYENYKKYYRFTGKV